MSDIEEVVDKFSGFLTKAQAEQLLKDGLYVQPKASSNAAARGNTSVKELLNRIKTQDNKKADADAEAKESIVNVKDIVYRIFNPQLISSQGRERTRRTIILGEEGSTIALSLWGKLSDLIDMNAFERGDTVIVSNALINSAGGELRTGQSTIINRVSPSKVGVLTDYSNISSDIRRTDIIGRVLEIDPIRHVNRLGKPGQMAVASCVVTDSANAVAASFWGSSAIATTRMRTNDTIKIEFCDLRVRDGRLQIIANDDSRVVASNAFAKRLGKR